MVTNQIYFSPRWKEMLGYTDHELENTSEVWASLIFEEDKAAAMQLIEAYNSDQVDSFIATQRYHHKDGSTVHVLCRAIHLQDKEGRITRMVGSHLDMTQMVEMQTALKESEMQLSGILDSSLDGIMAFKALRNEQGKIIDFQWLLGNPTACNIMSREPTGIMGKRLLEKMSDNWQELFDLYVEVVETGNPCSVICIVLMKV